MIKNKKLEKIRKRMVKKTLENNKLIVLFMGAYYVNDDIYAFPNGYYMHDDYPYDIEDYEFNSSMDWLIPVIEQIKHLGFNFDINKDHFDNRWISFTDNTVKIGSNHNKTGLIELFYSAIIEFIEWHNKK